MSGDHNQYCSGNQPEALRLADALEDQVEIESHWSQEQVDKAAAELRILHAANQELLKALKSCVLVMEKRMANNGYMAIRAAIARATIAKHGGAA